MNVKEVVNFDSYTQKIVVTFQPSIRKKKKISSGHHMGNQAIKRQSSSAWLEQLP